MKLSLVVQRRFVELNQRWFTRFELHHLFMRTGFRVESWLGGYNGEKKIEPGGESIWVLRPASRDELENDLARLQDKLTRHHGPL